jgi:hypothetical protein
MFNDENDEAEGLMGFLPASIWTAWRISLVGLSSFVGSL